MKKVLEYAPQDLNVNGVNLKATATTKYDTPILDLSQFENFLLSFIVDNTGGGAAGAAKIAATIYDDLGSTILLATDILTAIGTTVDRTEILVFGKDFAAKKVGNGTLGADPDILRVLNRVKLTVEVVTASDATTCLGYLRFIAR